MTPLNQILSKLNDPLLKKRIENEFEYTKRRLEYGIVFDRHIPETLLIDNLPIIKGETVSIKKKSADQIYDVISTNDDKCTISKNDKKTVKFKSELSVSRQYGDPVYPYLEHIETIGNGVNNHVLIESDNLHALEMMSWKMQKSIDCIYIDPPFNTGAKDWSYNNNYVDDSDVYRHSKWLAMMERRLKLAKILLKDDGVLLTAIDDREQSPLQLLLQNIFRDWIHMPVTVETNPAGSTGPQGSGIGRAHEFVIFTIPQGRSVSIPKKRPEYWETVERRGSKREDRPNMFYPIWVNDKLQVVDAGPISHDGKRDIPPPKSGLIGIYPPKNSDNGDLRWGYGIDAVKKQIKEKKIRAYKKKGDIRLQTLMRENETVKVKSVWGKEDRVSSLGTIILKQILGNNVKFNFPKSPYLVKDCISAVCHDKPNAVILDFFSGSGTTLDATCLLNKTDNGNRRCILITNNEENICQEITLERARAIITGNLKNDTIDSVWKLGEISKERAQIFHHIKKSELLMFKKIIKTLRIKHSDSYIINDDKNLAILFNEKSVSNFIKEIEDKNIKNIFLVTNNFEKQSQLIKQKVGKIITTERETIKRSDGFQNENLSYFKLKFISDLDIAHGNFAHCLLHVLWLANKTNTMPPKKIPIAQYNHPDKSFAILLNDNNIDKFTNVDAKICYIATEDDSIIDNFSRISGKVPINVIEQYRQYFGQSGSHENKS